ncbi:MAG: ABC transporter ATP-binding protein [Spirochaetales bacterium]|nr:ABC transporter ATP-binding protein [Spirochaetales bacterium]
MKGPAKDSGRTLGRLLGYLSNHKAGLVAVAICMILGSACSVRAVYYLKPIINDVIVPMIGQENPDFSLFASLVLRMAGMYLAAVLAQLLQGQIMAAVSNDVMCRLRQDMFVKMEHFPLSWFDKHNRGEIMSYYTNDVDALNNMLRQSIPRIVEGVTSIITILVTIFSMNLLLAALVTVCVLLISFLLRLLSGKKSKIYSDQQQCMQQLNAYGEEMLSGRSEVRAFSQEEKACGRFRAISRRLFGLASRTDTFANSMYDFTSGLNYLGFAAVAVLGCLLSMKGYTDPGTVGVFLQYYKKLLAPVTRIAKQVSNVFEAMAGAGRIFSFLDLETEADEGDVLLVQDVSSAIRYAWRTPDGNTVPCMGNLRFEHVTFGYGEGRTVLEDLSFEVHSGQRVAIIGTTGAGKTTVINLLSRFYEISEGTITFDGIDIRKIRKESLRRAAGTVLQDTHLFSASVSENISFGSPGAGPDDIRWAAETAKADFFINHLENGYDTVLKNDGGNLSQGERQLLSIARATAGRNPVLVLDEATSSIDSRTEMLVTRGLEALMSGKTVIVIAHRLATIRTADRIIVLDHGKIAETGSHEQLMERGGIYRRLYTGTGMVE